MQFLIRTSLVFDQGVYLGMCIWGATEDFCADPALRGSWVSLSRGVFMELDLDK